MKNIITVLLLSFFCCSAAVAAVDLFRFEYSNPFSEEQEYISEIKKRSNITFVSRQTPKSKMIVSEAKNSVKANENIFWNMRFSRIVTDVMVVVISVLNLILFCQKDPLKVTDGFIKFAYFFIVSTTLFFGIYTRSIEKALFLDNTKFYEMLNFKDLHQYIGDNYQVKCFLIEDKWQYHNFADMRKATLQSNLLLLIALTVGVSGIILLKIDQLFKKEATLS